MAAAAAATVASVSATATLQTAAAAPMTPTAHPSIPKLHQNEARVSNTTEQSLLIQNRSMKKPSIANALNKPTSAAASANAHTDRAATPHQTPTNEIDLTAPQSIAFVAGRKFIMVPKTAKAHASPDLANEKTVTKSS